MATHLYHPGTGNEFTAEDQAVPTWLRAGWIPKADWEKQQAAIAAAQAAPPPPPATDSPPALAGDQATPAAPAAAAGNGKEN